VLAKNHFLKAFGVFDRAKQAPTSNHSPVHRFFAVLLSRLLRRLV
jgi:hypothetical protein